jgi:UDP-GlcNAc3NAcA epimerase
VKILTVVGARPQFVKAAVISRLISSKYTNIDEVMVHTGQHFDKNMSEIFFQELEITKPAYYLDINNLSHGAMIGKMIIKLEDIFIHEKPDCVLVYGDTNSTLAAGIAAKKLNIKVAHVEAGVRNYDETMPEESNRYLVDRLSDFNFCCTNLGLSNLLEEGLNNPKLSKKNFLSGDVMYDAALFESSKSKTLNSNCQKILNSKKDFILATIHRPSNTDSREVLNGIIDGLNQINKKVPIILLTHPRTKAKLHEFNLYPEFKLFEPMGYFETLSLIKSSSLVITDSGGLVREAYFFKRKSLFLLSNPVWPELIETGVSINVEPNSKKIIEAYNSIKLKEVSWQDKIFGDGNAGKFILDTLSNALEA